MRLSVRGLTGKAVLIRRGTCGFFVKATNAQNAGAAAVVLYNNVAGALNDEHIVLIRERINFSRP